MIKTINLNDFRNAFINYGRSKQFTYEGLETLFNYLEEYEDETGEQLELDVIGLCCDFSELTLQELKGEYRDLYQDALNNIDVIEFQIRDKEDKIIATFDTKEEAEEELKDFEEADKQDGIYKPNYYTIKEVSKEADLMEDIDEEFIELLSDSLNTFIEVDTPEERSFIISNQ